MSRAIGINNGNWRAGDLREYAKEMIDKPLNDRELALREIKEFIGAEAFENWYRMIYRLRKIGKQDEYEDEIFKKLDEIKCPDSLFSEVILLEQRQKTILENYSASDNQDELTLELAEIQIGLDGHYGMMNDTTDAKVEMRFGETL